LVSYGSEPRSSTKFKYGSGFKSRVQSNADPFGSGSRPPYNEVLEILSMSTSTFFHLVLVKGEITRLYIKKNKGKYVNLCKN
jgi:hypothetical protein